MNNVTETDIVSDRSREPLRQDDLRRLADLALADLKQLFDRRPETGARYRDRLLVLCLCQGAAEHFVRPGHGIKDLDVWAFFTQHPDGPFPYRRRGVMDFGRSRFGRHPDDRGFAGRRVDVIGRSIPSRDPHEPMESVRDWLALGSSLSAKLIAQRPVVGIYPESVRGRIIWDPVGEAFDEKCD